MRYSFTGKNTTVTDGLKDKVTAKLGRLEKLFPENTTINVTFSVIKLDHKIEVTVRLPKRVLRAEVTDNDMYAAIDIVADKLESQMVKYKNRLRDKSRRDKSFAEELNAIPNVDSEEETKIVKKKKFAIKPMQPEDAAMEMELVGHNFFVFRNSSTEELNVVYKRKNGDYGLIEPEC